MLSGACIHFGKPCPQFCLCWPTWDKQPGQPRCLAEREAACRVSQSCRPQPHPVSIFTSRNPVRQRAMLLPGASHELAQSFLRSGYPGLSSSSNQKITLWSWASPSPFWITFFCICYMGSGFPQLRILRGHQTPSGYKVTTVCASLQGDGLGLRCYDHSGKPPSRLCQDPRVSRQDHYC